MNPAKRVRRPVALTALTLALALGVAACGSSSSSGSSGSSSSKASKSASKASSTGQTGTAGASTSFTAYTACLKSHGVTVAKRRGGFAGGFAHAGTSTTGTPPTGTRPTGTSTGGGAPGGGSGAPGFAGGTIKGNSKYARASKACASKLPKGTKGGFRAGGVHGGSGAAGGGGAAFTTKELDTYVACIRKNGYAAMPNPSTKAGSVFPKSVATNAKFKAANEKCQSLLTPATSGSASGSQTTTTASST